MIERVFSELAKMRIDLYDVLAEIQKLKIKDKEEKKADESGSLQDYWCSKYIELEEKFDDNNAKLIEMHDYLYSHLVILGKQVRFITKECENREESRKKD